MADGSIILDTRINNKGAYAELKELQAKAKSTAQQVAALDKQLAQAGAKHTSLGDDLKRARQEAAETARTAKIKHYHGLAAPKEWAGFRPC